MVTIMETKKYVENTDVEEIATTVKAMLSIKDVEKAEEEVGEMEMEKVEEEDIVTMRAKDVAIATIVTVRRVSAKGMATNTITPATRAKEKGEARLRKRSNRTSTIRSMLKPKQPVALLLELLALNQ